MTITASESVCAMRYAFGCALIVLFAALASACDSEGVVFARSELVGEWRVNQESLERLRLEEELKGVLASVIPSVILRQDGTCSAKEFPIADMGQHYRVIQADGKWNVVVRGEGQRISLQFRGYGGSLLGVGRGSRGNFIYFYFGDPDLGRRLVFQRVPQRVDR